jgi:predicted ATPase
VTATASRRSNLPRPLTSFVGRQRILAEVTRRLRVDAGASPARLLTLTGPGGCGKTRLALEAAGQLTEHFRDGVWFISLAPVNDPALVLPTIGQTLGVRDPSGLARLESVARRVGERQVLLVLDNFEQVLGAGAELVQLLAHCGQLRLLVTSRAALRVSG